MRAYLRIVSTLALTALGSCAEPAPLGALMVAMQTDMALPDDVAAVSLIVRSEDDATFGRVLHEELLETYDTFTGRYVRFPATFAVVEGEEPNRRVRIRLAGFDRAGNAVVLNEAVTLVPHERVALLRLPLQFTAQTSVLSGNRAEPEKVESSCPAKGEVEVAGVCRSPEIDSSKLPDYDPKDVFGGGDGSEGSGTCFSIVDCLAGATALTFDEATCSSPVPADGTFNLALKRTEAPADLEAETAEAVCVDGACYVPIDEDPEYGWRRSADGLRIEYTVGICNTLKAKAKVQGVFGSALCAPKTGATPICAPWSASTESKVAVTGAPGLETQNASFGTPERVGLVEQLGIRALGLRKGFVFGLSVADGSNASLAGRPKLLQYRLADLASPPTVFTGTEIDGDGLPNTGYRMAITDSAVSLIDYSAVPAGDPPSYAYVLTGYDAAPQMRPLAPMPPGRAYAVAAHDAYTFWIVEHEGSRHFAYTVPGSNEIILDASGAVQLPLNADVMVSDGERVFFGGDSGIAQCQPSFAGAFTCVVDPPVALAAGARPVAVAIDGEDLYAIDLGATGNLYRFAKTSGAGVPVAPVRSIGDTRFAGPNKDTPLGTATPYAIAADDRFVYYTDATGLRYLPKSDLAAEPGTIDDPTKDIRAIAVDDTHVYYGTMKGAEPAIYRVQKPPRDM